MASIDCDDRLAHAGPRSDRLGLSLFTLHLFISTYVLAGWMVSSPSGLLFYLLLLPAIATQWRVNRGSCVINNLESWLRSGLWHDPTNREEGAFLLMLCEWLFRVRPRPKDLDALSYATVFVLWLLACSHYSWLVMA